MVLPSFYQESDNIIYMFVTATNELAEYCDVYKKKRLNERRASGL